MKFLFILAGIAFYIKLLLLPNPAPDFSQVTSIAQLVVQDAGVPNAVSAIIFRNRLYDTIFEVIVFTLAILGCYFLLEKEKPSNQVFYLSDRPSIVLARLGATIVALVAIELAIRGHLSPGGGFAAGVAGGTAIGLVAITAPPEWMQSIYQRWKAAVWEKFSVLLVILLSGITLIGWELPHGELGALFSGGMLPILNMLVAFCCCLSALEDCFRD